MDSANILRASLEGSNRQRQMPCSCMEYMIAIVTRICCGLATAVYTMPRVPLTLLKMTKRRWDAATQFAQQREERPEEAPRISRTLLAKNKPY